MSPNDTRLNVKGLGAIACFNLPSGWIEVTEPGKEPGGFNRLHYSRDFSPGDARATLSIYFRGTAISDNSARKFKTLLHEPDHQLSLEEINSLAQVLSKLADEDAFKSSNCSTSTVSGRRVLVIDGEWKTSQTHFHGLMFDADDSAREVQEIFFEAPADVFKEYLNDVLESIRSIEWK